MHTIPKNFLKTRKSTILTGKDLADLYNAALLVETNINPSSAPVSGLLLGFRIEDQKEIILAKDADFFCNFNDLRHGLVTPVFGRDMK